MTDTSTRDMMLVGGIVVAGHVIGQDTDYIRAFAFVTLVMAIMVLILVNRSFGASPFVAMARRNPALLVVAGIVSILLALSQLLPDMTRIFAFARLAGTSWLIAGALALGLFGLLEAFKLGPVKSRRPVIPER